MSSRNSWVPITTTAACTVQQSDSLLQAAAAPPLFSNERCGNYALPLNAGTSDQQPRLANKKNDFVTSCCVVDPSLSKCLERVKVATKISPMTTNSVKANFLKTRLCPWFVQGVCKRGSNCTFAHVIDELEIAPDLSKTKLCEEWRRGRCSLDNCRFAHGREELRYTNKIYKSRICHFWLTGYCSRGKLCRHAHGAHEIRQPDGQQSRLPEQPPPPPLLCPSPMDSILDLQRNELLITDQLLLPRPAVPHIRMPSVGRMVPSYAPPLGRKYHRGDADDHDETLHAPAGIQSRIDSTLNSIDVYKWRTTDTEHRLARPRRNVESRELLQSPNSLYSVRQTQTRMERDDQKDQRMIHAMNSHDPLSDHDLLSLESYPIFPSSSPSISSHDQYYKNDKQQMLHTRGCRSQDALTLDEDEWWKATGDDDSIDILWEKSHSQPSLQAYNLQTTMMRMKEKNHQHHQNRWKSSCPCPDDPHHHRTSVVSSTESVSIQTSSVDPRPVIHDDVSLLRESRYPHDHYAQQQPTRQLGQHLLTYPTSQQRLDDIRCLQAEQFPDGDHMSVRDEDEDCEGRGLSMPQSAAIRSLYRQSADMRRTRKELTDSHHEAHHQHQVRGTMTPTTMAMTDCGPVVSTPPPRTTAMRAQLMTPTKTASIVQLLKQKFCYDNHRDDTADAVLDPALQIDSKARTVVEQQQQQQQQQQHTAQEKQHQDDDYHQHHHHLGHCTNQGMETDLTTTMMRPISTRTTPLPTPSLYVSRSPEADGEDDAQPLLNTATLTSVVQEYLFDQQSKLDHEIFLSSPVAPRASLPRAASDLQVLSTSNLHLPIFASAENIWSFPSLAQTKATGTISSSYFPYF